MRYAITLFIFAGLAIAQVYAPTPNPGQPIRLFPPANSITNGFCFGNNNGVIGGFACAGGSGAPAVATYIIQTTNATLTNAQVLASLGTGIVKNTTTTGVLSIAAAGTDYQAPLSCATTGALVFWNATTFPCSADFTYSASTHTLTGGTSALISFQSATSLLIPAAASLTAASAGAFGEDTTATMYHTFTGGVDSLVVTVPTATSITNGNCAQWIVSGSLKTLGQASGACGSGGGGGTGNAANVVTTTFSATPTFTCGSSSAGTNTVFLLSTALSANITSSTLASCTAGQDIVFVIQQAASGGPYTFAPPSGFDAAGVSQTVSVKTTLKYAWDGTNGHLVNTTTDTPSFMQLTERVAPGTPPAGTVYCWPDSTLHQGLSCKANGSSTVYSMQTAGGATSFTSLTSGTNTAAAMLVGTGSSLGFTGSGTVSANNVGSGLMMSSGNIAANTAVLLTNTIYAQGGLIYCAPSGGTTAPYACTVPNVFALTKGMHILFVPDVSTITSANLAITAGSSVLGTTAIKQIDGATDPGSTSLLAGQPYWLEYDASVFRIMGGGGAPVTSITGDGILISNSASTGPVTLTLVTAGAHKWLGNNTGSTAAPGYQTISAADLPTTLTSGTAITNAALTTPTFSTGATFASAPITINGNISAAAWTTSGVRIKGVPGTLTDTSSSGTVTAAYTDVFGGNTIAASSATVFTNYYAEYVNAPVAGTNVTLTNTWALGGESLHIGTSNAFTVGTTGHVTAEGVTSTGATGTGKFVFDTSPTVNGLTFPAAAGGAVVTQTIASGTAALGTGAIASAACATVVTSTATGTATTDVLTASFNGDPTAVTGYVPLTTGMLTIIAYPTSNTANFKVCNNTGGSITPGAITLNWRVSR